ncbi:Protein of unknown function [Bacillus wiedmannii]|nr:Protein of unknown function [Bacillus wiedmannii]
MAKITYINKQNTKVDGKGETV